MTIKELQAIAPKAEVYELRPDVKYLVLVDDNYMSESDARKLVSALNSMGIMFACVIKDGGDGIKVLELAS